MGRTGVKTKGGPNSPSMSIQESVFRTRERVSELAANSRYHAPVCSSEVCERGLRRSLSLLALSPFDGNLGNSASWSGYRCSHLSSRQLPLLGERQTLLRSIEIISIEFKSEESTLVSLCCDSSRAHAEKRIENEVVVSRQRENAPLDEFDWELAGV